MPAWRKLIASGSDASLNSLSVTTSVTASVVSASFTGSLWGTSSWAERVLGSGVFPYTGSARILGDINLTGSVFLTQSHISTVDWIDFTVDPGTPAHSEGRVHWNLDAKTLEVDTDVNNFYIPVGHASVLRGRNTNSFTLTKGTVVYINGNSGQFATFATASWESDPNSAYTIGIVAQDINTNQFGYAVTDGEIRGVDTNAYAPATLLYLSSSGKYTDQPPIAPLHTVRLGQVVVQSTDGILQVKIDNGYELNELHDVSGSAITGDILNYDGTVWRSGKSFIGDYSITGSLTAQLTGSLWGTSSWSANSVSASYAYTASSAESASYAYTASSAVSSSHSETASYSVSASYSETASFAVSSSNSVTSSYAVSASYWIGSLQTKAGTVSAGTFIGNPRTATVTFITPFADDDYAVTVTPGDSRAITVQNKVSGSFVISTNSNVALTNPVSWVAIKSGETL